MSLGILVFDALVDRAVVSKIGSFAGEAGPQVKRARAMNAINHQFDGVEIEGVGKVSNSTKAEPSSWLDQYSVITKIRAAVMGITAFFAVLMALLLGTILYLTKDSDAMQQLVVLEVRMNHAAIALAEANKEIQDYSTSRDETDLQSTRESLVEASNAIALGLVERDLIKAEYISTAQSLDERIEEVSKKLSAQDQGRFAATGISPLQGEIARISTEAKQFAVGLQDDSSLKVRALIDLSKASTAVFFVLLIIGPIVAYIFARAIMRNIVGMITKVTDAMEKVASGNTEVTIPGRHRGDEIGAMARALAIFRSAAQRELDQQRELEEERQRIQREKGLALRKLAENFEENVGEVATRIGAASSQIKTTATALAANAEMAQQQTTESAEAMNESSDGVAAAASASDEFALSISEVSRQAASSAELARAASQLAADANSAIGALSQDAVEIGEIVELIQSIAQRTNLLALNASIEAARSDEAGRGFAVVASEVKELAARTAEATDKVSEKIGAIQGSTSTSVSALASILASISELEQTSVSIASAVDQQSVASQELARNIDSAANGADQVSSRLGKLKDVATETKTAAADVLDSSHQLEDQAHTLRDKASHFLEIVRSTASSEETGEIKATA